MNPAANDPSEVVLFTGCVMDVWQPEVHRAAEEVLTAIGVTVERSGDRVGCCGALHGHAGLESEARRHAERVVSALTGDQPVLLDSAGCGAALKGYGTLLRTPEARAFADRVYDIQEWLAADGRLVALPSAGQKSGPRESVIVQDPCHLRHAQGCHGAVREVLAPHVDLVELDDEGLCCGAGGAFSLVQPGLAGDARDRKVAAVARATDRSGATTVVSANPGCALHLAAVGLHVRHPVEVLADACRRSETDPGSEKDRNEVSEHGR
ncbi:MAG: (Fe-S)-binding protein [Acidimicrobiales bacterium]|nr:(Fe-S)-binding protein [Acidimicrobiales bacterium]